MKYVHTNINILANLYLETKHITKTTEARLALCRKKAPCTWTSHSEGKKETTDYYNLILKKKWLW